MSVSQGVPSEVVNSDILILGGGIAGCNAAIKAKESGLDVVLVDKANIGRSGLSPQMSGVLTYFDPEKDSSDAWYQECVEAGEWISDQKRLEGMICETTDRIRNYDSWGVKFQKEQGEFIRRAGLGQVHARNVVMTDGAFQLMSVLRGEVLRRGVLVVERVMVTELLTSDGELPTGGAIVGAVGFNTRNGRSYIFKAKATVIATGSTDSICSVMRVPSLTGDGKAMAFRAGCEMRNVELAYYSEWPRDFNCSSGANILHGEGAYLINANGERFMHKYDPVRGERATRVVIARAIASEELAGRGPICLDATHLDEAAHRRIEMAIPIVVRSFAFAGLSLRKDRIPYTSGLSDLGPGGIRVNRSGETSVPGLCAAGATTDHAEDGVDNIIGHGMASGIAGYRAGEAAAKYSMEIQEPTIDERQVRSLTECMFDHMKRQSGLTYQEVMEHCVSIWERGLLGPVRNKRGLEEAIGAAQEIRDEEVPRLVARGHHELARSIGLGNGLLLLELLPRCALLRTESRGSHYREDYPTRDDQNWLKWVIAKKENNGIKVWAEPIPYDEYRLKPKLPK